MRFLCDSELSGGAWCFLPPAGAGAGAGAGPGGPGAAGAGGAAAAAAGGYTVVPRGSRITTCDIEVRAPLAIGRWVDRPSRERQQDNDHDLSKLHVD